MSRRKRNPIFVSSDSESSPSEVISVEESPVKAKKKKKKTFNFDSDSSSTEDTRSKKTDNKAQKGKKASNHHDGKKSRSSKSTVSSRDRPVQLVNRERHIPPSNAQGHVEDYSSDEEYTKPKVASTRKRVRRGLAKRLYGTQDSEPKPESTGLSNRNSENNANGSGLSNRDRKQSQGASGFGRTDNQPTPRGSGLSDHDGWYSKSKGLQESQSSIQNRSRLSLNSSQNRSRLRLSLSRTNGPHNPVKLSSDSEVLITDSSDGKPTPKKRITYGDSDPSSRSYDNSDPGSEGFDPILSDEESTLFENSSDYRFVTQTPTENESRTKKRVSSDDSTGDSDDTYMGSPEKNDKDLPDTQVPELTLRFTPSSGEDEPDNNVAHPNRAKLISKKHRSAGKIIAGTTCQRRDSRTSSDSRESDERRHLHVAGDRSQNSELLFGSPPSLSQHVTDVGEEAKNKLVSRGSNGSIPVLHHWISDEHYGTKVGASHTTSRGEIEMHPDTPSDSDADVPLINILKDKSKNKTSKKRDLNNMANGGSESRATKRSRMDSTSNVCDTTEDYWEAAGSNVDEKDKDSSTSSPQGLITPKPEPPSYGYTQDLDIVFIEESDSDYNYADMSQKVIEISSDEAEESQELFDDAEEFRRHFNMSNSDDDSISPCQRLKEGDDADTTSTSSNWSSKVDNINWVGVEGSDVEDEDMFRYGLLTQIDDDNNNNEDRDDQCSEFVEQPTQIYDDQSTTSDTSGFYSSVYDESTQVDGANGDLVEEDDEDRVHFIEQVVTFCDDGEEEDGNEYYGMATQVDGKHYGRDEKETENTDKPPCGYDTATQVHDDDTGRDRTEHSLYDQCTQIDRAERHSVSRIKQENDTELHDQYSADTQVDGRHRDDMGSRCEQESTNNSANAQLDEDNVAVVTKKEVIDPAYLASTQVDPTDIDPFALCAPMDRGRNRTSSCESETSDTSSAGVKGTSERRNLFEAATQWDSFRSIPKTIEVKKEPDVPSTSGQSQTHCDAHRHTPDNSLYTTHTQVDVHGASREGDKAQGGTHPSRQRRTSQDTVKPSHKPVGDSYLAPTQVDDGEYEWDSLNMNDVYMAETQMDISDIVPGTEDHTSDAYGAQTQVTVSQVTDRCDDKEDYTAQTQVDIPTTANKDSHRDDVYMAETQNDEENVTVASPDNVEEINDYTALTQLDNDKSSKSKKPHKFRFDKVNIKDKIMKAKSRLNDRRPETKDRRQSTPDQRDGPLTVDAPDGQSSEDDAETLPHGEEDVYMAPTQVDQPDSPSDDSEDEGVYMEPTQLDRASSMEESNEQDDTEPLTSQPESHISTPQPDSHISTPQPHSHISTPQLDSHIGTSQPDSHISTSQPDSHIRPSQLDSHTRPSQLDSHTRPSQLDSHTRPSTTNTSTVSDSKLAEERSVIIAIEKLKSSKLVPVRKTIKQTEPQKLKTTSEKQESFRLDKSKFYSKISPDVPSTSSHDNDRSHTSSDGWMSVLASKSIKSKVKDSRSASSKKLKGHLDNSQELKGKIQEARSRMTERQAQPMPKPTAHRPNSDTPVPSGYDTDVQLPGEDEIQAKQFPMLASAISGRRKPRSAEALEQSHIDMAEVTGRSVSVSTSGVNDKSRGSRSSHPTEKRQSFDKDSGHKTEKDGKNKHSTDSIEQGHTQGVIDKDSKKSVRHSDKHSSDRDGEKHGDPKDKKKACSKSHSDKDRRKYHSHHHTSPKHKSSHHSSAEDKHEHRKRLTTDHDAHHEAKRRHKDGGSDDRSHSSRSSTSNDKDRSSSSEKSKERSPRKDKDKKYEDKSQSADKYSHQDKSSKKISQDTDKVSQKDKRKEKAPNKDKVSHRDDKNWKETSPSVDKNSHKDNNYKERSPNTDKVSHKDDKHRKERSPGADKNSHKDDKHRKERSPSADKNSHKDDKHRKERSPRADKNSHKDDKHRTERSPRADKNSHKDDKHWKERSPSTDKNSHKEKNYKERSPNADKVSHKDDKNQKERSRSPSHKDNKNSKEKNKRKHKDDNNEKKDKKKAADSGSLREADRKSSTTNNRSNTDDKKPVSSKTTTGSKDNLPPFVSAVVTAGSSTNASTVPAGGSTRVSPVPAGGSTRVSTVPAGGSTRVSTVPAGGSTRVSTVPAGGSTGVSTVPAGGSTGVSTVPAGGSTGVSTVPAGGSTGVSAVPAGGSTRVFAVPVGGSTSILTVPTSGNNSNFSTPSPGSDSLPTVAYPKSILSKSGVRASGPRPCVRFTLPEKAPRSVPITSKLAQSIIDARQLEERKVPGDVLKQFSTRPDHRPNGPVAGSGTPVPHTRPNEPNFRPNGLQHRPDNARRQGPPPIDGPPYARPQGPPTAGRSNARLQGPPTAGRSNARLQGALPAGRPNARPQGPPQMTGRPNVRPQGPQPVGRRPNSVLGVAQPRPHNLMEKPTARGNAAAQPAATGQGRPLQPLADGAMNQATYNLDHLLVKLLKWNPKWLSEQVKCELPFPPPDIEEENPLFSLNESYSSFDDYVRILMPHLLMEAWEMASSDFKRMSEASEVSENQFTLHMSEVQHSEDKKFLHYSWNGVTTKQNYNVGKYLCEGDLVIINHTTREPDPTNPSGPEITRQRDTLGYVERVNHHRLQKIPQVYGGLPLLRRDAQALGNANEVATLQLKIKTRCRRNVRALSDHPARAQKVVSLVPLVRQFNGMVDLPRNILCHHILEPGRRQDVFNESQPLTTRLRTELRGYNESQQQAICTSAKIATQLPAHMPRICLLHGPPGTGKSHTIVGIIDKILRDTNGNARICLCAPSNAAVDELVLRLLVHKKRMMRESHPPTAYSLRVLKIGKVTSVHRDVQKHGYSELVRGHIQNEISLVKEKNVPESTRRELASLTEKISTLSQQLEHRDRTQNDIQRQRLQTDLQKLEQKKADLQHQCMNINRDVSLTPQEEHEIRKNVLRMSHVICGTLNSFGSGNMQNLLSTVHPRDKSTFMFDCIIMDEASQAMELDCLIPLQYGTSKLIMVGDPEQLSPTVLSRKAQEKCFGQSMFERMYGYYKYRKQNPVLLLDTQYRMNPEIASFPSQYVYEGKLLSDRSVAERGNDFLLKPYLVFDIDQGQEQSSQAGSIKNETEARFTITLCQYILHHTDIPQTDIGIIAPYQSQKSLLIQYLRQWKMPSIEVGTVDGFQGREKEVIMLSCVRASTSGGIGFVANKKRMNVALTRARSALYVVGNLSSLERAGGDWKFLIEDARKRKVVHQGGSLINFENAVRVCLKNLPTRRLAT